MKRTQAAKHRARRERPWHELLPPDPRDPDIIRVKALGRAASPHLAARHRRQQEPAMATPAPKPGDIFPPEVLRLLGTAQQVVDQHVNREGRCAACASRWPCSLAELAEFALGAF